MLETVITYSQLWKLWNLRHVSVGTTYIVEKKQKNALTLTRTTFTRGYRKCSTVIVSMHATFTVNFFCLFNFRCLPAPRKLDDGFYVVFPGLYSRIETSQSLFHHQETIYYTLGYSTVN